MFNITRNLITGCIAALALAACTDGHSPEEIAATARAIPDANDLRRVINENRYFKIRSEARNLVLEHWDDTHWAFAATEDGCPSASARAWLASDLGDARERSLDICIATNAYFQPHSAKFSKKPCGCRIVIQDVQLMVPRQELPQYLWAAVTVFNVENEELIIQRGMIGIEKLSFVE
jgi:hypothetical protein